MGIIGFEITKYQRLLFGRVIGISISQTMGVHAELANVFVVTVRSACHSRRPKYNAAQRVFKLCNRVHSDGVDHLLMKFWIGLAGS